LAVAVVIVAILIVAAVSVVLLAGRTRAATGTLSRETRRRDRSGEAAAVLSPSTELESAGRERADETRGAAGGVLARRRSGAVVEYEPVDEEELGVTRRQFLNRGLLTMIGVSLAAFTPAMLAFLWPFKSKEGGSAFGDVFTLGPLADILDYIDSQGKPYYAPEARTYVERYPNNNPAALQKAKKVYKPSHYDAIAEHGIVALYQRCPHLGCRVPFCGTSQWFECPCHGSKYNKVGEKTAGPAPRGMDHFYFQVDGGTLKVNTGQPFLGAPIGTDTTGQQPEGPLCV
jgi:cytochrome b6-f complex iron-sulfur subunit